MIIGSGVIANRFISNVQQSDYIIFAGNINDSAIVDDSIIRDEEDLITKTILDNKLKTFVYFSSCGILDKSITDSPYIAHKLRMEKLIQNSANKYLIFRLPQLLGLSDEKTSLVSYLASSIVEGRKFDVWNNISRNFIDIDDVYSIVEHILSQKIYSNKILNIAAPHNTPTLDIVQCMESYFGRDAKYNIVDRGQNYDIDISETIKIIDELKIEFNLNYIFRALNKYFRHLINKSLTISVIVPTYNEEEGIEEFYRRTAKVLKILEPRFEYEIIFINDFSVDGTYAKLQAIAAKDNNVKIINFSRNFGNQIAITAGIDYACGDIAIIIDDDLQDPPEIILNFIAMWSLGFKVVYGVRPKRQGVNPIFKLLAKIYYRLMSGLSEIKIPKDTGDFRLIDRSVVERLKLMREGNRYYRGMVAWVGFSQIGCLYERDKRYAGISTFSFKKYINFALQGLTSFTDKPLYFTSLLGIFIATVGFLLAVALVVGKIIDPSTSIRGWTSLVSIVVFLGGIQLLSVGIIGIYIGKIYKEVKGRPLYIVDETSNFENK